MDMAQALQAISQVGFPIVITGYLIVKFEKTLTENTNMLRAIATKLNCDGEQK